MDRNVAALLHLSQEARSADCSFRKTYAVSESREDGNQKEARNDKIYATGGIPVRVSKVPARQYIHISGSHDVYSSQCSGCHDEGVSVYGEFCYRGLCFAALHALHQWARGDHTAYQKENKHIYQRV